MKNYTDTIMGKIVASERMNNSRNGNPRYLVAIQECGDSGIGYFYGKIVLAYTMPDSSIGYEVDNPEYRETEHVYRLRMYRGKLSIQGIEA